MMMIMMVMHRHAMVMTTAATHRGLRRNRFSTIGRRFRIRRGLLYASSRRLSLLSSSGGLLGRLLGGAGRLLGLIGRVHRLLCRIGRLRTARQH